MGGGGKIGERLPTLAPYIQFRPYSIVFISLRTTRSIGQIKIFIKKVCYVQCTLYIQCDAIRLEQFLRRYRLEQL